MTGQSQFGSSDINLAAALLTLGIYPDPAMPIQLIARDNGKDYVRFNFMRTSACGKYEADGISYAWGNPNEIRRNSPDHPFVLMMDFIAARPRGCSCQDDWLAHAAKFLSLPVDSIRKTYAGIHSLCSKSPESPVSYVCAFIRNRMDLITAAKLRADRGIHTEMMDRGKSVSMIPAKAPKRIRDYLLSHIR